MMSDPAPVLAADTWPTNGHLIADCARLGYLRYEWRTLDPTYGKGVWWSVWNPDPVSFYTPTGDFRHLGYGDDFFDAIAFDPPYVAAGGRNTTGLADMHRRYGMTDAPRTPMALQVMINQGLTEMHRLLKPRGILLAKCQDYVSSGKLWLGTHHTLTWALDLGFDCVDRFEMLGGVRPQPPGRRQVHARRNLSTLFVFSK